MYSTKRKDGEQFNQKVNKNLRKKNLYIFIE